MIHVILCACDEYILDSVAINKGRLRQPEAGERGLSEGVEESTKSKHFAMSTPEHPLVVLFSVQLPSKQRLKLQARGQNLAIEDNAFCRRTTLSWPTVCSERPAPQPRGSLPGRGRMSDVL